MAGTVRALLVSIGFFASACGTLCPIPQNAENTPDHLYFLGNYYAPPFNVWVKNRELELALQKVVAEGGIDRLTSRYLFQCSRTPVSANCPDCYACSRSLPMTYDSGGLGDPFSVCRSDGEVLIRVDVGPGSAVTAMTFRKTVPTGMTR